MTTIPAEKLDKLVARWQSVQGALASGADQESFVRLSREFAELDPIVATINALRKATRERDDLQQLLDDPASDKEMVALAEEELAALGPKLDEIGASAKSSAAAQGCCRRQKRDPRGSRRHRRR